MPAPASDGVPRWFWLLALLPAVALTTLGGAALVLAMLGWYSLPLALVVGAPLFTVGAVLASRAVGRRRTVTQTDLVGAIGAGAVALASLAFNGLHPGQHVVIDRDPGSYLVTARWLARDGTLRVDATTGAFEGAPRGVRFNSAATYDTGDGELEFQFNHLISATLAMAYGIGGQRLLFRLPALAAAGAVLPLYVFARVLTRRAWVAVAITAGFAACLPLVSVARGTYSESFTLLVLWSAMIVLVRVVESRGELVAGAVVAGGLFGATCMTRIDAIAYVVPLVPVAAWLWSERRRAVAFALVGSAAVAVVIGAVDGRYFSGRYYADLGPQRRQLEWLLLVVIVLAVLAAAAHDRVATLLAWLARRGVAIAFGVATFAVVLFAWLIRPRVITTHGPPNDLVGLLQERQGLPVDPTRLYSEDSLRWFAWYLGPITVLAAAAGAGLVVERALRRREPAAVVLTIVLLFGGLIYVWRPSITPDHIWVMRRFVPLVLPAFLVLAGLAITWLVDTARMRSARLVSGAIALLGAAALVIPPAFVTGPVRRFAEQAGYLQSVREICRRVPGDAAVVVSGSTAAQILPESLRAWCGVPTASMLPDATRTDIVELANQWAADCRPLVLVAQEGQRPTAGLDEVVPDRAVVQFRTDRSLERVVDGVPSRYRLEALTVTVGVVPVRQPCRSADP